MGLNDIAATGAPIEVSFYDAQYDDESEEPPEDDSRDDFMMCFVGPTPAAILQVQRDMMVRDVVHMMERHFEPSELDPVVAAITQHASALRLRPRISHHNNHRVNRLLPCLASRQTDQTTSTFAAWHLSSMARKGTSRWASEMP